MQQVTSFVRDNRDKLSENIDGLNVVSKILVKQRDALSETLNTAPLALNNLFHTYNPATGTLDTRANLGENIGQLENDPKAFLCSVLAQADASKKSCDLVKQALSGLPRTAPLGDTGSPTRPVDVEHIDRSLAGLVEVDR
jgi:ABC-type transporter Mla subunit MlaD